MQNLEIKNEQSEYPKVAIIVVNYNSYEDITSCLGSIAELTYPSLQTIVVDNDSPDGSGELLAKDCLSGGFYLIKNNENRGFAAGVNEGIGFALGHGVDYVWLVNPDIELEQGSLKPLLDVLEECPDAAAAGSKVLYGAESRSKIWSAGGFIDTSSRTCWMRGTNEIDSGQYNEPENCSYIPGCSMMIRSSSFEKVGLLPEHYFMYFEETHWCLTASNKGLLLKYVPESVVYHHFSDEKMQKPFTVYYYNRNSRFFWMRFASVSQKVKIWFKGIIKELPQVYRAYRHSRGTEQEHLFRAHFYAVLDSVTFRAGRRWK